MKIFTIILGATSMVCVSGWVRSYLAVQTLLRFIELRGYPFPTKEELGVCSHKVAEKMLNRLAKGKH